jgi:hypothetical protein
MMIDPDSLPEGARRLLWDFSTIGLVLDSERPTAAERLSAAVGDRAVLGAALLAASVPDGRASASDVA